ncbi:MAG: hypothetical protein M8357_12980 [Desulfobulbaceae bacterium]|nr:hypothetical protein [Desulfobulbaceae bacterium]
MKKFILLPIIVCTLLFMSNSASAADELYILTTRDGSVIVAREYRFTDEHIEYTTESGLPGFIKREEFVKIANMIGVPPGETEQEKVQVSRDERSRKIWLLAAAVLAVLLVYLSGKRRKNDRDATDIYHGRRQKEPISQGLLSFDYKGPLGCTARWTIEVRSAYEEEEVLFIEGVCTTSEKRKTFRADRVVGPVTDMSRDHHAPMEHFFADAKEKSGSS